MVFIPNTFVVSGFDENRTENYENIDKIYLLAPKEVFGATQDHEMLNEETRQLDYYETNNVTLTNYSFAIKKYKGNNNDWWLRSARSISGYVFFEVAANGSWSREAPNWDSGVSPAFRIG